MSDELAPFDLFHTSGPACKALKAMEQIQDSAKHKGVSSTRADHSIVPRIVRLLIIPILISLSSAPNCLLCDEIHMAVQDWVQNGPDPSIMESVRSEDAHEIAASFTEEFGQLVDRYQEQAIRALFDQASQCRTLAERQRVFRAVLSWSRSERWCDLSPKMTALLVKRFQSDDPFVSFLPYYPLQWLLQCKEAPPDQRETLHGAFQDGLKSEHWWVRAYALQLIYDSPLAHREEEALPDVWKQIHTEDPSFVVRFQAANHFWEHGPGDGHQYLLDTLATFHRKIPPYTVAGKGDPREALVRTVKGILAHEEARPMESRFSYFAIYGPEELDIKYCALEAMRLAKLEELVEALPPLLRHPSAEIRRAAALAAGDFKYQGAWAALVDLIRDVDRQVRDAASRALYALTDKYVGDVPEIQIAERHEEWRRVRHKHRTRPERQEKNAESNETPSEDSADGPNEAGFKEAVLAEAFSSAIERLAESIEDGSIFRESDAVSVYQSKPLEYWLSLTESPYAYPRCVGIFALGEVGKTNPDVVPTIVSALHDPNEHLREQAAKAIAEIGKPAGEAVPALVDLLDDPFHKVRGNSALALKKFGQQARPAVPALQKMILSNDEWEGATAVEALAVCGDEIIPSLIKNLASTRSVVRRRAAEVLARIGPDAKDAIPTLEGALEDPEMAVQRAADEALTKIRGERSE